MNGATWVTSTPAHTLGDRSPKDPPCTDSTHVTTGQGADLSHGVFPGKEVGGCVVVMEEEWKRGEGCIVTCLTL